MILIAHLQWRKGKKKKSNAKGGGNVVRITINILILSASESICILRNGSLYFYKGYGGFPN